MARRRERPCVSAEDRERALGTARALASYMLAAEVDDTRRRAIKSMEPRELREVVAENPGHPLVRSIGEALDLAEAR